MSISDKKLYALCKKYGHRARLWRQKFAGLLPEVYRRKLFEKKGFHSIFEFAAKLAGMSQESVRLVLNLDRRFDDKPILKNLLQSGEVSVNKLARVASIATTENQDFWAEKSKILPSRALETLVKDVNIVNQDALDKAKIDPKSMHVQTLQLSTEVTAELLKLKSKGIDINRLLIELLKKHRIEIAQKKEQLGQEALQQSASRYIPAKIRNLLKKEHGSKCSLPHCSRPATTIHHTQRFALGRNHDPRYLAPLCREHHIIAHAIDVKASSYGRVALARGDP